MRNKQLFQKRLEQLDNALSAINNGIQMGASIGEVKKSVEKIQLDPDLTLLP